MTASSSRSGGSGSWTSGRSSGWRPAEPEFWIGTQTTGTGFREADLASPPPTERPCAVLRVAVELRAEVLHEPRLWPEYHDTYYAAFVRDPDGNNVEAVCDRPE